MYLRTDVHLGFNYFNCFLVNSQIAKATDNQELFLAYHLQVFFIIKKISPTNPLFPFLILPSPNFPISFSPSHTFPLSHFLSVFPISAAGLKVGLSLCINKCMAVEPKLEVQLNLHLSRIWF